jgi:hypothetical protein
MLFIVFDFAPLLFKEITNEYIQKSCAYDCSMRHKQYYTALTWQECRDKLKEHQGKIFISLASLGVGLGIGYYKWGRSQPRENSPQANFPLIRANAKRENGQFIELQVISVQTGDVLATLKSLGRINEDTTPTVVFFDKRNNSIYSE